jgi:putative PEP-CTERM system histidine kinase
VATHLAQHEAEQRIAEGQQFEAYSKLTAFMMHDLKNSVAQLQLLVENSRRHRHNPEFVDDAIETVRNTAQRISRLVDQLQSGVAETRRETVQLAAVVRQAAESCAAREPRPSIAERLPELAIVGDRQRLTDVVQHIIRNAQEATPPSGSVKVVLARRDGHALIEVSDTGQGMTPEFRRDGLFRPFLSTKGAKGMGVGAYQAREYARSLGGEVEVRSEPGRGTTFRLILPLSLAQGAH